MKKRTNLGTMYCDWDIVPLPEKVFFQEGPGLREWQWTQSGMKVINVTNILADGQVDVSNTKRFISTEEYEKKYSHFAVQDGDIILASSGNTYGKIGRIDRTDLPLMMNTSVIRLHPKQEKLLDSGYLYSFMRSRFFKNQIESFVIGSAQPNFGPAHLKQMQLICPPLPTQRKIAAILSAYDDLIENNLRRIKILEEMAQNLYREWFVNFRFPGHEKVKMVDSSLGKIPEGWSLRSLFDISDVTYGFPFQSANFNADSVGKPVIRIRDLKNNRTSTFTTEGTSDKYQARNGDILVGMDGDFQICNWSGGEAFLNQRIVCFRARDNLPQYYLSLALQEPIHFFNSTISGTTVNHLGDSHLRTIRIQVPNDKFRLRMREAFDTLLKIQINLSLQNSNLQLTRDLLLPKLISGELDVSNLDIKVEEVV